MPDDRLLKPLPAEGAHYALTLGDRTLIMAPRDGGHSSVLELRAHDPGIARPVHLKPIAELICIHLDEWAAALKGLTPRRVAWDPNTVEISE